MKTSLRLYVYAITLIGLGLVTISLWHFRHDSLSIDKWLFLGLTGVVQLFPVALAKQSYIAVSWSVTYAAILLYGPEMGVLCGSVVGLVGSLYPRRQKTYKLLFNVASNAISAYLAARLLGYATDSSFYWAYVLLIVPLIEYVLSTGIVTLAISLTMNLSPLTIWNENFRWQTLHNVLLSTIGFGLYKAFQVLGWQGLVIFMLPLIMARYSFKLYLDETNKVQTYVESLEQTNGKLEAKINEMAALQQHSLLMSSTLSLDQTLAAVFQRVTDDLPYEPLSIDWKLKVGERYEHLYLDPETGELNGEVLSELEPAAHRAFHEGKRIVFVEEEPSRTRLLCPMIVLGEVRGVMTMLCPQGLLEEHDSSLDVFVSHATAAISNANLFQQMERIANTDNLTKLYNRHYFSQRVRELSQHRQQPLTVIIMDFDNFKDINNCFGHHVGDLALHHVASLIKKEAREQDIPVRFGGDEFALLMPGVTEEEGLIVAAKLHELMREPVMLEGQAVQVGLSFGIATCLPSQDVHETVKKADKAAYVSKSRGKGCITLHSQLPDEQAPVYTGTGSIVKDESDTRRSITRGLLQALKARDVLTYNHSLSVAELAVRLGQQAGLTSEEIERIKLGALLHDIGKLGISDLVLYKNALLSEKELLSMRTHPVIGYDLLRHFGSLYDDILPIVLHHHERIDGTGYPHRRQAGTLDRAVRIVAIADAFDSMTRDHSYRERLPVSWAVRELQRCAGTQFDAELVACFIEALKQYIPERNWDDVGTSSDEPQMAPQLIGY